MMILALLYSFIVFGSLEMNKSLMLSFTTLTTHLTNVKCLELFTKPYQFDIGFCTIKMFNRVPDKMIFNIDWFTPLRCVKSYYRPFPEVTKWL